MGKKDKKVKSVDESESEEQEHVSTQEDGEPKEEIRNTSTKIVSNNKSQAEVVRELKSLYFERLKPIEEQYKFDNFFLSAMLPTELEAKPNVLLIGQYSTGKTTFIKHLIGRDYGPNCHIGPEPTTDRFVAVVHGQEEQIYQGNTAACHEVLPFGGLNSFGAGFLNKFEASVLPAPILKNINIIDTPGVLSGEKQRTSRGYDFAKVSKWFAERSDLILLMFDPSKLDISDEFKTVIEELRPYENKVHCVLNKADSLDTISLMRVYGALLYSMGKVFRGAEVVRVFVGSFKDEPIAKTEHAELFKQDYDILLQRLHDLPKSCAERKVNEMIKRIRLNIVNICLLGYLKSQMPLLWGSDKVQNRLINDLESVFQIVKRDYQLADGDMPNIDEFRAKLRISNFNDFPFTDKNKLQELQDMLTNEIPLIFSHVAGLVNDGPTAGAHDDDDITIKRSQPTVFKYRGDMKNKKDSFKLILIITVFVLLLAIAIASHLEKHKTALEVTSSVVKKVSMVIAAIKS